ncbi:hypothetical protein L1987_16268 [Smallanthus sonchifolius]|uniref:Uncharacterized protein n=1 Tax=Smallanthus sonchifolius TaxID=185202 RepID=A0ACB9J9Z8_9ASTR|nr:hypothetical protein L1987_16268 [Smallanthus sonchifolius]
MGSMVTNGPRAPSVGTDGPEESSGVDSYEFGSDRRIRDSTMEITVKNGFGLVITTVTLVVFGLCPGRGGMSFGSAIRG